MALQVPIGSPFTIDNLPYGVGRRRGEHGRVGEAHVVIAIGDHALDCTRPHGRACWRVSSSPTGSSPPDR